MARVETEQLSLFDLGPNMQEIREQYANLKRATRAPNTLEAYRSGWQAFTKWCVDTGRTSLPTSSETIALYVTARLSGGLKTASIEQQLAAIAYYHRQAEKPVPSREEARAVIQGAKRQRKEEPARKTALTPDQLRKICRRMARDMSPAVVRDRAILVLGFATGLRRSNLGALSMDDIEFRRGKGVIVYVRSSKTDQTGIGQSIGVRYGRRPETCPVRTLRAWLDVRGEGAGPVFAPISTAGRVIVGRGLCGESLSLVVKAAAQSIGLDRAEFGGHSLRAGCVTAAHVGGASTLTIMQRTGHHSVAMVERYLRNRDPFAGPNPLAKAL